MRKLIILALVLLFFSNVTYARTCLPYAISEALKYQGQPSNYKVLDLELGKKDGYYIDKALKKLKIVYKRVKNINTFPVIVEYDGHSFAVTGSLGKYWRVNDINCSKCLYSKKEVKEKALNYYQIES